MTPKTMQRYHSKGIFTVTQLSFLYKPRRRRRRALQRSLHFNLEIQALAIRTGKIYIQALPEIQKTDVALFLDIEGVPDRKFSYLIGLLVHDHETATQYSFWADAAEDEESIWQRLMLGVAPGIIPAADHAAVAAVRHQNAHGKDETLPADLAPGELIRWQPNDRIRETRCDGETPDDFLGILPKVT